VIVEIPLLEQVAAAVLIVGSAGIVDCGLILNEELATEVHEPLPAVTE
jgi:hypothetical protein